MLSIERHGDVTRVRMTSWRGRSVGYSVSAYLVRGVLVDTGFSRAARELTRFLDAYAVRGVMVTHWHEDHAGNAAMVAARGLPMMIAPETLDRIRMSAASIRFYRRYTWGVAPPVLTPVAPFEDAGLRAIHTPGHSPDHYVAWDEQRATLFSGDLFLGVKVRTAFPDEDPRQLIASLRRVAALGPRRMFDAHRGEVRDPTQALTAKADWLSEIVSRIEARIDAGWSDRAIRRDVLGREGAVALLSGGEYSKLTLVRAVRASYRSSPHRDL